MSTGFSKSDFTKYPPHDKVRISTVSRSIDGIRQLSQASMWKEVLKLVANKEDKFLMSYAIALQHIHAPEVAKVLLLDKVSDGDPFTLKLMKGCLMGGRKSSEALFQLLFEIEREIKCMDSTMETYFPVRMRTIEFLPPVKTTAKVSSNTSTPAGGQPAGSTPSAFNPIVNVGLGSSPSSLSSSGGNSPPMGLSSHLRLEEEETYSPASPPSFRKVAPEISIELLKEREKKVCFALVAVFLENGDVPLAIDMMERMCNTLSNMINKTLVDEETVKMKSLLGLMYLSHGQLQRTKVVFKKIEKFTSGVESVQILMNRAYVKFAEEKYTDAIELFQKVMENEV